jgi:3-deoxy-D-arabino-heptulosonate 7-phosphate (DAHP) synthase
MSDKILIPSEMLEPVITKTLADIFSWYGADQKLSYRDMEQMITGLSMFVSNCNATHCNIAITNVQGMIWQFEKQPQKLRKLFKEVADRHYSSH